MNSAVDAESGAVTRRLFTFKLSGSDYGVPILRVQEIVALPPVTPVPRTPEFVRGVINLRGRVVPVVDLRTRFGMAASPDTDRTCVVIIQVEGESGAMRMGVVVEDLAEVVDVPEDDVVDPPEFGAGIDTEFLLGMGRVAQRVIILLDVDKVLTSADVATVRQAAGESTKGAE